MADTLRVGFDPHNCLVYVAAMWWKYGGYVIVRRSPRGWWPHFWWSQDLVTFQEYTPIHPRTDLRLPPPLYRGRVVVTRGGTAE